MIQPKLPNSPKRLMSGTKLARVLTFKANANSLHVWLIESKSGQYLAMDSFTCPKFNAVVNVPCAIVKPKETKRLAFGNAS